MFLMDWWYSALASLGMLRYVAMRMPESRKEWRGSGTISILYYNKWQTVQSVPFVVLSHDDGEESLASLPRCSKRL